MFRAVQSRVNFPEMEEAILKWWQEQDIFGRSVEQRRGGPSFILYDGPPTVNGSPAIHHVLTSAFKDIIPRYKAMKGFYAPRIAGWDTHGLPVELEIEKELGFSGKSQIEEYGVARFNELCRKSVDRYLAQFEEVIRRVGYWADLKNAYVTYRNEYIESDWWAIKRMWDKGLVYQGYRVTPHCPRCGTSLSSHEVAQGYQDNVEDPSIYVKFRIVPVSLQGSDERDQLQKLVLDSGKQPYLLAWTTTPWTLPANTALAVAADAEYVVVEVGSSYLILANARVGAAGLGDAPVMLRIRGTELVGLRYEPLFNPGDFGINVTMMTSPPEPRKDRVSSYPVISTDFVSMDDGTGIVHMAPAYGEVDYEAGQRNVLDFVHTVDLQGRVIGDYPFAGKFVKSADPLVVEDLRARGLVFRAETVHHTYPFCWRCETPLLYYAKQTWYIRTTALKDRLIAGNTDIEWHPDYIKYGRFGDWLQNNVDWAFSRERYWGTPLPVWRCQSCGEMECIGGLEDIERKPGFSGFKEPLDLHRPFVDDITYQCSKCGGEMRRAPEVIDCWFDSGAMPFAQFGYKGEGGTPFDERFPADFISEAVDQTRGWFYSLHAISTLLFDRPSYKNVICLGHILDAKGEKMSKRKGNVVWPWDMVNKYGADALRWHLFTATPPGNARRFEEKQVLEVTRRFLLTLWNVYSFFVTYANIDRFDPAASTDEVQRSELDRWIISELHQLIKDVETALDSYDPTDGGRKIEAFVDRLSNWYVRRSRRRFWKSGNDADKLAAYSTLYECLVTTVKLLAPFTPFIADEIYRNLVAASFPQAPQSVHLADFPTFEDGKIDSQLSADIRLAMDLSSLGRATRSQAGIKVRQPLPVIDFGFASVGPSLHASIERIKNQLLDELNVKDIKWDTLERVAAQESEGYVIAREGATNCAVSRTIPADLKDEGMAREIVHRLQTMRRSAGFDIADHVVTYYEGDTCINEIMAKVELAEYIKQETLSDQLHEGVPSEGVYAESYKLEGHETRLAVKRL